MFRSDDIHPVTDFVRNHKRHLRQLRETGRPGLLTINGTPEVVLQDVRAFEREAEEAQRIREENRTLRERLEDLETLIALDEAYAEMERGVGRPMEEALPALRDRLGMEVRRD
jgi:PHD/YefM family antitoxin component YafN of YafNO toxin-antitoxin module